MILKLSREYTAPPPAAVDEAGSKSTGDSDEEEGFSTIYCCTYETGKRRGCVYKPGVYPAEHHPQPEDL